MSADELFPIEAVAMDSPRLAWIKKHKVHTFLSMPDDPDGRQWMAALDVNDYDFESAADLLCQETGDHGESRIGTGSTEDEAICALAKKWSLKLWNEEGAQ